MPMEAAILETQIESVGAEQTGKQENRTREREKG